MAIDNDRCESLLEVVLEDGRQIWSDGYSVVRRCGRVLAGRFIDSHRDFVSREAQSIYGDWPVVLIEAEVQTEGDGSVYFPAMQYMTRFSSEELSREYDTSELIVVWFQEARHPPIAESVRNEMAKIDWATHAKGGLW